MAKDSDAFRENAENCLHLAEEAANEPAAVHYQRMAQAWFALATEQDWLDGHPTQGERASELAGGTLDKLSDNDASNEAVKDRKSSLIDGPPEFRNARVDNG
ncbi:hypothetical protein ACWX0K_18460 [Nitrobacteraceae bacterium UC4446_H13]